jgi:hypothetical protein
MNIYKYTKTVLYIIYKDTNTKANKNAKLWELGSIELIALYGPIYIYIKFISLSQIITR